ncbi:MAG: leucine-rich repeat domain-containing protein [Bacilli bacterium]|nr:leucine-rich repeat domain-containing protein [Bacilli bacterium]
MKRILIFITIILVSLFTLTSCGKESEGLEYKQIGSEYMVIGIGTCTDENLVIPSEYEGLPVTLIGVDAFKRCNFIKSVVIPGSVNTIGGSAFSMCEALEEVTISKGVITIGEGAFGWCEDLKEIDIPSSVTTIGEGAFSWCENLREVDIPSSVTTIMCGAFNGCKNATIYCEVEEAPSGWDPYWRGSNCEVVWKGQKQNQKDEFVVNYKKDNFTGKQVGDLSEEMYIEISKAYAKSNLSENELSIVNYYGEYNGAYVVSTLIKNITFEEFKSLEIGGVKFPDYPDIVVLRVYKNGYVYTLEEAYEQHKTITRENLSEIVEKIKVQGYLANGEN